MSRPTVIRVSLFLATVVAIWGVLSLGSDDPSLDLTAGDTAPADFHAVRTVDVVDEAATEQERELARAAVEPIREIRTDIQGTVESNINAVFVDIQGLVIDEVEEPSFVIPELPEPDESAGGDEDTASQEPSVVTGRVFLDVNGDGVFSPTGEAARLDQGLAGVRISVRTSEGVSTVMTDAQGVWSVETSAAVVIVLEPVNGQIPTGWIRGSGDPAQLIVCDPGATCEATDIGFVPSLRPLMNVESDLLMLHANLSDTTIAYLAATASDDVIRDALGEVLHLPTVLSGSLGRVRQEFGLGVQPETLAAAQLRQRTSPPFIHHSDTREDPEGSQAAGDIVAVHLQANDLLDPARTEQAKAEAAAAVAPVTRSVRDQELIVSRGQILTEFHLAAISAAYLSPVQTASMGLLAVIAVLVGVVGLYLSRFRQEIWARPRMVALLGILFLVAAASVRLTVALAPTTTMYVLPAVAFGFITAVLFDQRVGLLMALGVGVITALGTNDLGMTVYAVLATMAPIPFVSAVTTRGAFRNAAAFASLTAAAVAAATSWFFHVGANDQVLEVIGLAAGVAFASSMVASLVGLAGLQFFESAFDVTTTLSLLDLTDRNHAALQLLQEKAFGTFNHSLMVGTLADAASRSIGANPLLARAMAYYHDLGKTENPTFFIENQFGAHNPHDDMDPKESAEVLRNHVTAGVALARKFKIPTDVTQGIVSHHGDGVMRYFYEKARASDGDEVNIDDFRHIGHKPRTAETAILMLADSLEAACRAVFQVEEPTAEAIEKVVSRIIDEKVEDGQLSESPLTLGELTQIRKAFLDSLVGHYHQRIAYPNFPGSNNEPSDDGRPS